MTQLCLAGPVAEAPSTHGVLDFWPTPDHLARRMVEWAGVVESERIVEPSAGDGALLRALPPGVHSTAVEVNPARESALREIASEVVIGDWPTVAATWAMRDRPTFDLALSNPPFSCVAAHLWPMVACARRAVVLLPLTALEGQERYREVWSRVRLLRLAVLVGRPRFGGEHSPATAYCVAEIAKRGGRGAETLTSMEWWT